MTRILLLSICSFLSAALFAQLGGQSSYRFLDLPSSARVGALGGTFISVHDDDLNLSYLNPALLDSTDVRQVALNYTSLFADAANGFASYAVHVDTIETTFSATVQYLSYGDFIERDEVGNELGTFSANEFLFSMGAGRSIDSLFSIGANLKIASSSLAEYKSSALALDLGGAYLSKNKEFSMGLVFRNAGFQLSRYREGSSESLPFGIDLGMSKRLSKSPLRLSLTLADLQQWGLSYVNPADLGQTDPLTGELIIVEGANFGEKLLLHTKWSMEFLLGQNFHLRLGYDYRRRQELALSERPGLAGISWGLGLKISKLHLSYANARYNQAGVTNHIGLTLRFADFNKSS